MASGGGMENATERDVIAAKAVLTGNLALVGHRSEAQGQAAGPLQNGQVLVVEDDIPARRLVETPFVNLQRLIE